MGGESEERLVTGQHRKRKRVLCWSIYIFSLCLPHSLSAHLLCCTIHTYMCVCTINCIHYSIGSQINQIWFNGTEWGTDQNLERIYHFVIIVWSMYIAIADLDIKNRLLSWIEIQVLHRSWISLILWSHFQKISPH